MRLPAYPLREAEPVKYFWREWYTRAVDKAGRVWHFGPWLTRTAAEYCAVIIRRRTATTDETPDTMEAQ